MSHAVFIDPRSYKLEASVIFGAFLTLIVLLVIAPKKPSEVGARRMSPAE